MKLLTRNEITTPPKVGRVKTGDANPVDAGQAKADAINETEVAIQSLKSFQSLQAIQWFKLKM